MTSMRVSYSKGLSIAMLVVGVLLLLSSLLATQWVGVLAGGILGVLGILMLVNPIVTIESGEVQLRSPLGIVTKRFPVSSAADLRIDGKKLMFVPTEKKIVSLGFGIDGSDVDRLRAQIA